MSPEREPWERIVVLDDGTRAVQGLGYLVEIDENDEPVDILAFVSPGAMRERRQRERDTREARSG